MVLAVIVGIIGLNMLVFGILPGVLPYMAATFMNLILIAFFCLGLMVYAIDQWEYYTPKKCW